MANALAVTWTQEQKRLVTFSEVVVEGFREWVESQNDEVSRTLQKMQLDRTREELANAQELADRFQHENQDLRKELEKAQDALRLAGEANAKPAKPAKVGHWAAIVAKVPDLLPLLEMAVRHVEAGRSPSGLPPALTSLRLEAGSWPAALQAVHAAQAVRA